MTQETNPAFVLLVQNANSTSALIVTFIFMKACITAQVVRALGIPRYQMLTKDEVLLPPHVVVSHDCLYYPNLWPSYCHMWQCSIGAAGCLWCSSPSLTKENTVIDGTLMNPSFQIAINDSLRNRGIFFLVCCRYHCSWGFVSHNFIEERFAFENADMLALVLWIWMDLLSWYKFCSVCFGFAWNWMTSFALFVDGFTYNARFLWSQVIKSANVNYVNEDRLKSFIYRIMY